MDSIDWHDVAERINADIKGIVHAQLTLEQIHEQLESRLNDPLEEDLIDLDAFGQAVGSPRVISIDGVEIQVTKLHRKGLASSDVQGADLLYEIAGRKYVLVQYKRASKSGRVKRDADQLEELLDTCPVGCTGSRPGDWHRCGGWISVWSEGEYLYLPACRVKSLFGKADTRVSSKFAAGMSKTSFQELFARCWIGARVAPVNLAASTWNSIEQNRVLVTVLQRGTFGRW